MYTKGLNQGRQLCSIQSTNMKKTLFLLLIGFLSISTGTLRAQAIAFHSKDSIAINGYDPVAYFVQQEALPGSDQFQYSWSGSKWKFISQENLDKFKAHPSDFAPQYGGYCAYGASENHLSPTDPKAWTIVKGKLYLNYSTKVKGFWVKDSLARIETANGYWPNLQKNKQ